MSSWRGKLGEAESIKFSVVDLETTGLFPGGKDRIIEIAIIQVDGSGRLLDQYVTLVNPSRDLGPTHVHHLSGADVKEAPSFVEVAGDVLSLLAGTVFAGYYPQFDFRFLKSELDRLGHEIPPIGLLCVNDLARDVAPDLPGRKLEVCCKHFGVRFSDSHTAGADALATAKLLHECFKRTSSSVSAVIRDLGVQVFPRMSDIWPGLKASGKSLTRAGAALAAKAEPNYIARLVASLPVVTGARRDLNEYYALLDRILEDRIVTADEAGALAGLARDAGISKMQAESAHFRYMRDLVLVALADDVITEKEEEDLRRVARLLSISNSKFEDILSEARTAPKGALTSSAPATVTKKELTGLSVCFTGELTCHINGNLASRTFAEAAASEKGMVIRKSVTKDLDILVAADPNSMSGKARKARQYNIRVVAEPVFWQWMNINID